MIDFSEYGDIIVHRKHTELNQDVIQFHPKGHNYSDKSNNLKKMIALLDGALEEKGIKRGILINKTKRFPKPCVIIFDHHF